MSARVIRFLPALVILAVALIVWLPTLGWGLPSRDADKYLFGDRTPWTGREILALTATTQPSATRGADVDADPILDRSKPVILNDTDAKRAAIVRRYRLMSGQPDEFIQFKALSEMASRPGLQKLDPRLYQYGGLWMYPVGAMVRGAMLVGIIEGPPPGVPALEFYLDRPDAFGRFYVVARFYSWCWGVVAALAIVWLARRITNSAPLATLAAVAFMLTPVVRTATHEAKPHLAGAALCLCAVIAATRYVETGRRRWAIGAGVLCGASMAMVVSMLLSIVVIPTMVWLRRRESKRERIYPTKPTPAGSDPPAPRATLDPTPQGSAWRMLLASLACAGFVYAITNPFVIYNALAHPEILRSNLGNSTAMYSPRSDGIYAVTSAIGIFARGVSEEAVLLVVGGLLLAVVMKLAKRLPLAATTYLLASVSILTCVQFVLLAQGKPAEYARFGLVMNAAVWIAAALGLSTVSRDFRWFLVGASALWLAIAQFVHVIPPRSIDATRLADQLATDPHPQLRVNWEPAPWSMPPCDLFRVEIRLERFTAGRTDWKSDGLFPLNLATQIGEGAWLETVDWKENRFALHPYHARTEREPVNSDSGSPGYPPASRTAPTSRGR